MRSSINLPGHPTTYITHKVLGTHPSLLSLANSSQQMSECAVRIRGEDEADLRVCIQRCMYLIRSWFDQVGVAPRTTGTPTTPFGSSQVATQRPATTTTRVHMDHFCRLHQVLRSIFAAIALLIANRQRSSQPQATVTLVDLTHNTSTLHPPDHHL